jgi:hypothetical protein
VTGQWIDDDGWDNGLEDPADVRAFWAALATSQPQPDPSDNEEPS